MKHMYKSITMLALALAVSVPMAMAADVNHETVLTGDVVTVVPVGTAVHEGDTLVTVQTLAGPMVAARATVDGVVGAIDVAPGAHVDRGQVVVVVNQK